MSYDPYFKRLLDLGAGGLALALLSPWMALVALAIRLEDGGPVLFRQVRVGLGGRPFTLFKFRSMPVDTQDLPSALAGELRVTKVGRFIRRTNLDELPQLFCILRGQMSLVGPRPALARQEGLLRCRQLNGAAMIKPGLTGLAQVSSYDGMPEEAKATLDGQYARSISFLSDVWIILRTFTYLARRPPVY